MTASAADGPLPTPLGDLSLTTSTVVWALVAVLLTFLCARWASTATLRVAHRLASVQDDLALRAARLVRYFVLAVGAGIVLVVLGADIQPLLVAVVILAGVALLMLRGIADNLGAGLVLQTRRPVRLGDLVESGGHTGRVSDLNSRSVVLVARDGRTVHLPNGLVMAGPLVNHSRRRATRSEVVVEWRAPDVRLDETLRAVVGAAGAARGVLEDPAPSTLVTLLAPHRAVVLVRIWHTPGEGAAVRSRVVRSVHEALTSSGLDVTVRWPLTTQVVRPPAPDASDAPDA